MTNDNYDYDFGFGGEEFQGELDTVPYCQFLNGDRNTYGLAIIKTNAELAGFEPSDRYQAIEHEFNDGSVDNLYITREPRMVIINRSEPLMSNETETVPYDKNKYSEGGYKAFSYCVVWLLDDDNKLLSELPFRLKCSGFAGLTFLKNYQYYNNGESFTKKFLQVYKSLTGDRAVNKNDVFYAHAVYQPKLVREKATSSFNGQSSFAVQTISFLEPSKQNFPSLIIKNGSSTSNRIKELMEETQPWLKGPVASSDDDTGNNNSNSYSRDRSLEPSNYAPTGESMGLTPPSPQKAVKPIRPIATKEQEEYVRLIEEAADTSGWTLPGLIAFLDARYRVNLDKLDTLPENKLIEIYNEVQDVAVRDMYVKQNQKTEIPF